MSDWPIESLPPLPTVGTASLESLGPACLAFNSRFDAAASAAIGVANRAYLYPFTLTEKITSALCFWANGATVNGHTDFGIYTAGFTKIATLGTTVQANINVIQSAAFVVTLAPGLYFMALATDSTTATYMRVTPSVAFLNGLGVAQMASAFVLPATVTPALMTGAYVPIMGITERSFV